MKQGAQRCQRNTSTLRKRLLRGSSLLGSTGCVTFSPRCPLCAAVTLVSTRSSVPEEASCSCGRLCEDGRTKNDTEPLFLISCTIKARDAFARSSHSWFSKAPQLRRMSGVCWRGGILAAVAARAKPFHALGRGLDRISTVVRMSNGLNT